jgi:DNA-binding SARP family transcriptional activator/tetratricopeptide (TPR) repeat protein
MRLVMNTPGSAATRAEAASARLLLRAAGRCAIHEDAPIDLEPKDALLLAYLVVEGPTPRGRLATLLWPDVDEERARGNLRQRLLRLKRTTGVELVVGNPQATLAPGINHDLDDAHELLHGIDPPQAGGMAEWLDAQRHRRRRSRIDWLDAATTQAETEGDLAAALEHANALVALDPLSEHAHRRVMKLHYLRGDTAAATAAYERCRDTLRRELHAAPSKETEALRTSVAGAVVPASGMSAARTVPLSVLRPPRLIGRDHEWAVLNEVWQTRQSAVVVGEPGMGKTRLLTDLATAHGNAVTVTARPGDLRVPHALLSRLVRLLLQRAVDPLEPGVRKELARLLPELGEAEPLMSDSDRVRFINAVQALLHQATARGAHGIVVDDLQYADGASVETLQQLAGAEEGLAWVIAHRPGELPAESGALIEELAHARRSTHCRLQPLKTTEVAELIDSLGVAPLRGDALAPQIAQHTGGNPLFVLETLKALLTQGPGHASQRTLPVTPNVTALIERRIGQLSPEAIRLARCAAIAGQEFSADLAARVLGTRPLDLADAWNELERAQVLRDGAFVHDLIYEAARASVPAPIARELHREIASLLAAEAAPATVAEHWRAAGEWSKGGDCYMRAAAAALAASRRAEEADFLDAAIACFAQAGRSDDELAALLQLNLALTFVDAGQRQQAALDRMLAVARTPQQRLCALTEASYCEANRGNRTRSVELAEQALALAEELGDRERAFKNADVLAIGYVYLGRHEDALAVFESQRAWVETQGNPGYRKDFEGDRSWALLALNRLDEAHEALNRAAGIARGQGDLADLNFVLALQAAAHARAGDPVQALALLDQAIALHEVLGSAGGIPTLDHGSRAWMQMQLGRYTEALANYDMIIGAFDANGIQLAQRRFRTQRALAYLRLGQPARARQNLPNYESEADVSPLDHLVLGLIERELHGSSAKALAHFRTADPSPRMASTNMSLAEVARIYQIEAMPAEEARTAASELAALAQRRGQNGIAVAALAQLAQAAAACGERGTARDAALQSRSLLTRWYPDAIYRGDVWLWLVTAWRTLGDLQSAADTAREAVDWVESVAREHVPETFRESFRERNVVNRRLRESATRGQRA